MPYRNARPLQRLLESPGTYTKVLSSPYYIVAASLKRGINIFGIATGAPTTVYLPASIASDRLIAINDESGFASTSPITITGA